MSVLLRKCFTLTLVASFTLLVWTKVKEEEMRKRWTDWRQISEVKSIQFDGLHVRDKGEAESRVTSVSGLNNCWLQRPLTWERLDWGQAWERL